MNPSNGKRDRLNKLSTANGVIAALATDQRKSLRERMAQAASTSADEVSDFHLSEFKTAVSNILTPHGSAVLLDPEYGLEAARERANNCGLLLAYELDDYENLGPHRMLALMPHLSVRRLRGLGADELVIQTMEEFSRDIYNMDVLKVEFPVISGLLFVAGRVFRACCAGARLGRTE